MNLHSPDVSVTDAELALTYLKEGNERFVSNNLMARTTNKEDLEKTKDGQKPFATVLTCSDSRTSPEIYFDQKIGDIFIIRNAGNYATLSTLGSIEFGAEHLGAPLVVVVGHTMCGAVAASHGKATGLSDNLQNIINNIRKHTDSCSTKEEAVIANVKAQVEAIKNNPVIKKVGTKVVGAEYNIATGKVTWL
ncbi:MAG: carbonic anhydrase [Turicibacter sp.]|nr:carbonic anhydrase [Turicibacter sp.]